MVEQRQTNIMNYHDVSRDIFSASLGSILCCYTGQPFDTIKVRIQTNPTAYNGLIKTGSNIVYNEGLTALWKGSVPTAIGMIAENAMAFGVNEALKRSFHNKKIDSSYNSLLDKEKPDFIKAFSLGAFTGCCSALVLLPSEVIKAKTQVVVGFEGASSIDIMRSMIRQQGIKSLFCGLDAQLIRDGIFYAVFFGIYELNCYLFKTYIPSFPEELNYFMSGGFAGMMGWSIAMPFDVPKTNVQVRWCTNVVGSYFPEMIRISQQHGLSGFYNGLGPTLVRAFPANAALFLGVEIGKKFFENNVWSNN